METALQNIEPILAPRLKPRPPVQGKFCVYSHSTNGKIFYIGAGLPKRPFDATRRNQKWADYVAQNGGKYEVAVLEWFDHRNEAARREAELIEKHNPPCNILKSDNGQYVEIPPELQKVVIAVYLPVDLRDRLDAYAREAKVSRSWIFSRICEGWLADQEAAE